MIGQVLAGSGDGAGYLFHMTEFAITPRGPFSLAAAQDFAGGFPAGIGGGEFSGPTIAMSFPVEGSDTSAAVELAQATDGRLVGRTDAAAGLLQSVVRQASRSLSVDHDGAGWPAVGQRDPVIGAAQQEHNFLRPVCFYSAYEAATSFVIGQRISRRQTARVKAQLADSHGDRPSLDGHAYPAFPRPERLLEVREVRGLSSKKLEWLHGLSRAALDGKLNTESLRAMPRDEALARLRELPGVGPFTAEAVWLRGCGVVDELPTTEGLTMQAVGALYGRPDIDAAGLEALAEVWRPYRMWAVVLLRVAWGRSAGPTSYRSG
jgi:DNA-3-methyladenine glycosylase II